MKEGRKEGMNEDGMMLARIDSLIFREGCVTR